MTKYKAILEILDNMDLYDSIEIYNKLAYNTGLPTIYYMEDLNDIASQFTPRELIQSLTSSFDIDDTFVYIDDLDNLCSFSFEEDAPIYNDEIAQYIIDDNDDLGNKEIKNILDNFKESEEN